MKSGGWINPDDVKTVTIALAVALVLFAGAKYYQHLDEKYPEHREEYIEPPR